MLIRILKKGLRAIRMRRDPVAYARSLGVKIGEGTRFYGLEEATFGSEPFLVTIGCRVHIVEGVRFVTHDGGTLVFRPEFPDLDYTAPIEVGDDVYIGMNALILPGVKIGSRSIVAAGAVVSRPVPAGSVVGGVPARVLKSSEEYLAGLKEKSLGCGALSAAEKEAFLRRHFGKSAPGPS